MLFGITLKSWPYHNSSKPQDIHNREVNTESSRLYALDPTQTRSLASGLVNEIQADSL